MCERTLKYDMQIENSTQLSVALKENFQEGPLDPLSSFILSGTTKLLDFKEERIWIYWLVIRTKCALHISIYL